MRGLIRQQIEAEFQQALGLIPAGSIKEEFRSNFNENYTQMKAYGQISTVPVYVITSTKVEGNGDPAVIEITKALHAQWAAAAGAKGKFVTTNKSGHYIQIEEPHLVVDGIRWVMQ
jgi:pimeloyl-ACP methyl ester carboxylesterase